MASILDELKTPPHETEAEKAIIAWVLMDNDLLFVYDGLHLHHEDMYHREHMDIYEAIQHLRSQRRTIDVITLSDQLSKNGSLDIIWGKAYLYELNTMLLTTAPCAEYAQIVKEKSILRRILKVSQWIIGDVYEQKETLDIIDAIEKKIFNLTQINTSNSTKHIKELLDSRIENYMEIVDNPELINEKKVLSTYPQLDDVLGWFKPGELIIIAARPAVGKTAFALNVMMNASLIHQKSVALFSLEMSNEQLVDRILCAVANIPMHKVTKWQLENEDFASLWDAIEKLGMSNMYIDDKAGTTIPVLKSKLRRLKIEQGTLDLVIIDYLQLMSGAGSKFAGNRVQEISEISRWLKELARELEVPIIALSQLSRTSEQRTDKKPQLSDLRESWAIEQDADVVMMLYREDYYDADTDRKGVCDVLIRKNRNGPVWEIEFKFTAQIMKFNELSTPVRQS